MNNIAQRLLSQVEDEGGKLVRVEYVVLQVSPRCVEDVILTFENTVVTVCAVSDDDSIKVVLKRFEAKSGYDIITVSDKEPWKGAIGQAIMYAWSMINITGLTDAIQIEFANSLDDKITTVQLFCVGSTLLLSKVESIEEPIVF